MIRSLVCATVLCLALPASAQSASYQIRPGSCGVMARFMVSGLPRLGQTFQVSTLSSHSLVSQWGITAEVSLVLTGVSDRSFAGVSLPFGLETLSGLNCGDLRVSMEVVQAAPITPSEQVVAIPFAVPNDASLLGMAFHQQVLRVMTSLPVQGPAWMMLAASASGHGVIGF